MTGIKARFLSTQASGTNHILIVALRKEMIWA
jgi:hypothetical protein